MEAVRAIHSDVGETLPEPSLEVKCSTLLNGEHSGWSARPPFVHDKAHGMKKILNGRCSTEPVRVITLYDCVGNFRERGPQKTPATSRWWWGWATIMAQFQRSFLLFLFLPLFHMRGTPYVVKPAIGKFAVWTRKCH